MATPTGPDGDYKLQQKIAELTALYEVSLTAGTSLDLGNLLPLIMEMITGLKSFDILQKRGGIFLVEGEKMKLLYYLGDSKHMKEFIDLHEGMKVGDCLCGFAAKQGEIITSASSPQEELHSLVYPGIGPHGHVIVPLKAANQVVGVMSLFIPANTEMDERPLNLLRKIGDQLGAAIANAWRYQVERDGRILAESYADALAKLNRITLSLHKENDPQQILQLILSGAVDLTESGLGMMITASGAYPVSSIYSAATWFDKKFFCKEAELNLMALKEGLRLLKRCCVASGTASELNSWLPSYFFDTSSLLLAGVDDSESGSTLLLLLGHKREDAEFSTADEAMAALLLAQGGSALLNARHFMAKSLTAEVLQSALLPAAPALANLDIGLVYLCADPEISLIGGDFYDFVKLDDGNLAIAIGDCSGHGLPAAQHIAMMKYMLHAFIKEDNEPGQCLTKLNAAIFPEMPEDGFVTFCLLIIDSENECVSCANAGHLPPLALKANGAVISLDLGTSVPLGILPDQEYPTVNIPIEGGYTFVFYSDGLIEGRNQRRSTFGCEGLIQAIRKLDNNWTSQQLTDHILQNLGEHAEGGFGDDVTLIVVRLTEETAAV